MAADAQQRIGAWLHSSLSSDPSSPDTTDHHVLSFLSSVLESSADGIVALRAIRDERGTIVDFEIAALSASAEQQLNLSAHDVVGTPLSRSWPGIPDERFAQYVNVVETGTPWMSRIQMPHSAERWFDITASNLSGQGVVTIFRDVTAQMSMDEIVDAFQQRQQVLERQALHDPLTGLANRLLVESRLEHALSRLDRIRASVAILFIDLDGFKSINDTYGHAAGDAALIEIGTRLRSVARSYDTVGRVGGDEFVIVCEDLDSAWDIDRLAHRFVSVCAIPVTIEGDEVVVTASVGVAVGASSATAVAEVLRDADRAMYRAKKQGGGRVQYFDAALNDRIVARHDVERGLQRAIDADELHVGFHPVVAADGEVVASRAHIGWMHPLHGLVESVALFDAAYTNGAAPALADWLLDQAFSNLATWLATASEDGRFVIVDIVGQILTDRGFTDRLDRWLQQHRIDPRAVCLAVDGAYMTSHVDEVKVVIEPLVALGVRIARVGVAASGSALTYLRALPIDIVILDNALVDDPGRSDDTLLRLVIDTAKGGNRLVIAPVVASSDDRDVLFALGVDLVETLPATTNED